MKSLLAAFKSHPVPPSTAGTRRPRNRWRSVRIERVRLRLLTRQQTAIAELGRRVLEGIDEDRLLTECAALVALTLQVDSCAILECLPKDGQLIAHTSFGLPERARNFTLPDTLQSLAGQTLRRDAPSVARTAAAQPVAEEAILGFRIRSSLGVVIGRPGRHAPFGVLQVYCRRERRFTADDVFFAEHIANTAAAALAHRGANPLPRSSEDRPARAPANSPGMVYQVRLGADGQISVPYVADGCREMLTLEPGEIYADPLVVIGRLHEEDRGKFLPTALASARSLAPFHWTGRYQTREGEMRWLRAEARVERRRDGSVTWDGVMLDVSELQRAQEALLAAKEEAERANRAKSEFLSRISHELRTPLNAILGFSQFLQRQTASGTQEDCLDHITKAGHHLLGLINEVLDISRVEAGHAGLARVPVAIGPAVNEAFALVRPAAAERGISLGLESPGPADGQRVLADPQRFKQILFNLLSNAVKYNVNGGKVRVSCAAAADESGALEIAVADTGPGIPADKLKRLFVAFDRLGAEQTSVPGAGLGLVLVRCLVEALDGSVAVDSTLGQGTVFRIRLPGAGMAVSAAPPGAEIAVPAGTVPAPSSEQTPLPTHRVLYIEDNASNLNLVERLLRFERPNTILFKATCAADGMEIVRREPLDLVLLDLHLPDMRGDRVLTRIRSDVATRGLPVVVTSADATAASIDRLTDLGANAYLTKPYNLDALLAIMQRLLEKTARHTQLSQPPSPG